MSSKTIRNVLDEIKSKNNVKLVNFSTKISESLSQELTAIREKEGLTRPQLLETLVHLYKSENSND